MKHLRIRRTVPNDALFINAYWKDATADDLDRLGELGRPDPDENIKFINWFCSVSIDPKTADEDIRMWCMDGNAVGYSTLKAIRFGIDAQIHLHLARPFWRKGIGSVLFSLSAEDFLKSYKLQNLYCQPRSEKPMPNGMLKKISFDLKETIDFRRPNGSIIKQNRYRIDQVTLDRFLKSARGDVAF